MSFRKDKEKLFLIWILNNKYRMVIPHKLADTYQCLFNKFSFRKVEDGTLCTMHSLTPVEPDITLRCFADRDEEVAMKEATDWFEKKGLDIYNSDNWLVKD